MYEGLGNAVLAISSLYSPEEGLCVAKVVAFQLNSPFSKYQAIT